MTRELTPELLRELYNRHAGELCAYLEKLLRGDRACAEDLVQEAFLLAWRKREQLRDLGAFKTWLFTIGLNQLRQEKRKRHPMPVKEPQTEPMDITPEQETAALELRERLRRSLDALPEEQREAIILVRFQSMSFSQASEMLQIPENTVKTRVRRGLLKLAQCVDPCPEQGEESKKSII